MSLDSELLDLALQSSGEASQHTSKLIRRLRVVMITEKCAPELLMYEDELMQDIAKEMMANNVEETDQISKLSRVAMLMDLERVKYMRRSYLRQRIWKYPQYTQRDDSVFTRLSGPEKEFLNSYVELMKVQFERALLSSLPEALRNVDEEHMVATYVAFQMKEDVGNYMFAANLSADMNKDDVAVARYDNIKTLLSTNSAILL